MRTVVVDIDARIDLIDILNTSHRNFGRATSQRYRRLIDQALSDLARDPERRGSVLFETGIYIYHLRHSRLSAPVEIRVRTPRHLLIYRFTDEDVQISRVLHDSMDIPSRLK